MDCVRVHARCACGGWGCVCVHACGFRKRVRVGGCVCRSSDMHACVHGGPAKHPPLSEVRVRVRAGGWG
jgi:hypothetical protein